MTEIRIIPVIDIKDGIAVFLRRGKPEEYEEVKSILVGKADPILVAEAFQKKLGLKEFYISDLNATHHEGNNFNLILRIAKHEGIKLIVDVGINALVFMQRVSELCEAKVVITSRNIASEGEVEAICKAISPNKLTFCIEMKHQHILSKSPAIAKLGSVEFINLLTKFGLRQFIILELLSLGGERGVDHLRFIEKIISSCDKDIEVITGGGIRNIEDVLLLRRIGVSAVLVGTALHRGHITKEDISLLGKTK